MNIQSFLDEMKLMQDNLLEYLDKQENDKKSLDDIKTFFEDQKIQDDINKLKLFMHILTNISKNHHRQQNFFDKIDQILEIIKKDIQRNFTSNEIFNIFHSNKRILLFLIENKIIILNKKIVKQMSSRYSQYFSPEIKSFKKKRKKQDHFTILENTEETDKESSKEFYKNRKIGENDNYLCMLIRTDLVDVFIEFVAKNNINLNSRIEKSIFGTNSFLIKKMIQKDDIYNDNDMKSQVPSLIEYAAFFGSIKVFKYLYKNEVKINPSICPYAIHGNNPELIHLLEEIMPLPFKECYVESIKCHHNDLARYIYDNYSQENEEIDTKE